MTTQPATAPGLVRSPRTLSRRLVTIGVVVVTGALILAAAYVTNGQSVADNGLTSVNLTGTPSGPAPVVGQLAPAFTVAEADGTSLNLSSLRGSIVWLSFGASWCQPCRAENADLEATYQAFKDKGVVVVQAFMDDDAATVTDYAGRVGLTYIKVPDPNETLATEYRILGIPTHFFIDRDGVLRVIKVGTLQSDEMAQVLTDLGG